MTRAAGPRAIEHRKFEITATLGFVILAALLARGRAFSIRRFAATADAQVQQLREKENQITLVEHLRWNAEVFVSDGRGYLLSGEPGLLSRVLDSRQLFEQSVRRLGAQTLVPRDGS